MYNNIHKKSYKIKLPKNIPIPTVKYKYSNTICKPNFNTELCLLLHKYKSLIDNLNENYWNNIKKKVNPFELIHVSKKNSSITLYTPISRAYYKFWEILSDYDIIKNVNCSYAALAEGPGGFIESFVNKRKCFNDKIYCITLIIPNKNIPNWNKAYSIINNNNIYISTGSDGTGNLYNLKNILHFYKETGKVDLVTGDGGIDYSNNFNIQEQLSYRLIFCEIVTAFTINKIGGSFVLKIFDVFTQLTVEMLYLLNCFYDHIIISKPFTSRPANSEKYIIAKGFKGVPTYYLHQLYYIVNNWNDNIYSIIENIPSQYYIEIQLYNKYIIEKQIENIILALVSDTNHCNKFKQVLTSMLWCKKYNIQINYKCNNLKYIKNYKPN